MRSRTGWSRWWGVLGVLGLLALGCSDGGEESSGEGSDAVDPDGAAADPSEDDDPADAGSIADPGEKDAGSGSADDDAAGDSIEPDDGTDGETPEDSGSGADTLIGDTTEGEADGASSDAVEPGPEVETACTLALDAIDAVYADVPPESLESCSAGPGATVSASLMNLYGVLIDNNGDDMEPCIAVRCDDAYAYIAANALPHYDFVQTTPNALVEVSTLYRIPLEPMPVQAEVGAEDVFSLFGCEGAYSAYVASPGSSTGQEPGGYCSQGAGGAFLNLGGAQAQKIPCLGTVGAAINGSPLYGPNEGPMPDPFGNPGFYYPDVFGQSYVPGAFSQGAALDLCGGHTANSMHYHALFEPCFERDEAGAPANSYIGAVEAFDFAMSLGGACTEESPILGWSLDGYPIKGPCVCLERGADGECTDVRRARSSWVYDGLSSWGESPQEAGALGVEGTTCGTSQDCCAGQDVDSCDFRCKEVVVAQGDSATALQQQCVLLDFSWCTSRPASPTTNGPDHVHLDVCNGIEGADGYAYHATMSFPFLQGCYRGYADPSIGAGGGPDDGGGGPGGGGAPDCADVPPGLPCCGDGFCGGPETPANCPADCP